ncbi:MAG: flagellin [Acetobacteraceae bacterium]|nr:flagellin [Acetobacteraceae bacterium]NBS42764.1 flagellin [Acetobacteraceae bacterium]
MTIHHFYLAFVNHNPFIIPMRRKKRKANPVVATRLRASALLEREDPMGFSVNTNTQAVLALQGLAKTDKELGVVQKRVSSGLRVADARDDGGAFAAALSVRSDVAGLTAVNEQLGGVKGIVETTFAALNKVSDTMKNLRQVVTRLADSSISTDQRAQYETQFSALTSQITNFIQDSKYNGRTLLSTSSVLGGGDIAVLRNENADTFDIAAVDGAAISTALTTSGLVGTASGAATFLTTVFTEQETNVATALNQFGSDLQYVDNQIGFNSDKIDALNSGLGALVDADLAKESAKLQALQVRQQLGIQTLGLANQGPQVLLSLFR